jgi:hypothetical protein
MALLFGQGFTADELALLVSTRTEFSLVYS